MGCVSSFIVVGWRTTTVVVGGTISIAFVCCRLTSISLVAEKPYEEAAFVGLLKDGLSPVFIGGKTGLWSEQPPGAFVLYRLLMTVYKPTGLRACRAMSIFSYTISFALTSFVLIASRRSPAGLTTARVDLSNAIGPRGRLLLRRCVSSDTRTACLCLLLVCAFLSPALLMHASRANGVVIGLPIVLLYFVSLRKFALTRSWLSFCCVCGLAATLVATVCYGLLIALGGLLAAAVANYYRGAGSTTLDCRNASIAKAAERRLSWLSNGSQEYIAFFLIILVACAAAELTGAFSRRKIIENHYWAMPVRIADAFGAAHQWRAALGFWPARIADPASFVACGMTFLLLMVMRVSRLMSPSSFILGFWILAIGVGLLVWEWLQGNPVMVTHLLAGQHYLLMLLLIWVVDDLSERFGTVAAGIAVWTGLCGLAFPCIGTIAGSKLDGDSTIRRAVGEIIAASRNSDMVLFGGSRAYVLFEMHLPDSLRGKARVFLRGGAFPDNFPYRGRFLASQCVYEHDLPALSQQRVVFVKLEAAQSITIDFAPWTISSLQLYGHPCNSIGDIYIAALSPRRDPPVERPTYVQP